MQRAQRNFGVASIIVSIVLARGAAGDLIDVPADYATIQAAIDAAFDGDVIELADGTYTGAGNKNLDFLGKAITLRGNGSDVCTIDCQNSGRAFIIDQGEGPNTRVEGITVLDANQGVAAPGGGARLIDSSPTFVDVTFRSCQARYGGAVEADGGTPTFEDCHFETNSGMGSFDAGGPGGAAFIENAVFTGCTFTDNHAGGYCGTNGGAISCLGEVLLIGCQFQENSTSVGNMCMGGGAENAYGGAISAGLGSSVTIVDSTFTDNGAGSGCNATGGAIRSFGSLTLLDVTFDDNHVGGGGTGVGCGSVSIGAVSASSSIVVRGTFTYNRANGGTPFSGAPIGALGSSDATIIDSVFVGNSALGSAGAASIGSSTQSARIINSLFISNWSDTGATAALSATNSQVVNCTFIGNNAYEENNPPGAPGWTVSAVNGTIVNSIIRLQHKDTVAINPATGSVSFSNVQGGWSGAGGSNIDAPPVFADAAALDFRLFYGSPGIDAGRNGSVPADTEDLDGDSDTTEPTPLDLADGPRFVNDPQTADTGTAHPVYPTLPIVDMGAYEYDPCAMADLDGDGTVGFFELTQLLVHWGECPAPGVTSCPWDRDGDGEVGFNDLTLLLLVWGPCA